ncbi:MAG: hypothetical protein Q4D32_09100, partial [Eubacteriales bacterium]|nr:hypothetical protein [Eubacteriales bacterium]
HPRENEVSNTNKKSKDVTNIKEVEIEGKKIIDTVNLNLNDLTTTCMEKSPEIDNFIEDSDDVIEGVVESVEYFDCNGLPWSCLHVKTMDSLFGNIKKREKVEIYVMEGYTFSDYTQKYLIEYTGDERGMHQIGDKSIYILSKESPDSVFGENVYMRTYSCFSEYRYDELKNKYIEYDFKGDTKESSRDSLVNLIKNYFGN